MTKAPDWKHPVEGLDIQLPQNIDNTFMTEFRSCPRQTFYSRVCGLKAPGISPHLHAGGCFAFAIEEVAKRVFAGMSLEDAKAEVLPLYSIKWGDYTPPPKVTKTMEQMWNAVEGYFAKWHPLKDHLQPYFVNDRPTFEYTFAIPLDESTTRIPNWPLHPVTGQPFLYSGRFDLFANWNGLPAIRDEKTTSRMGPDWGTAFALRSQFMGYCWAASVAEDMNVKHTFVRGVKILKGSIDYVEVPLVFGADLKERWLFQLWRDLHRIVDCWNKGYFDLNFGHACDNYSLCSFFDLCKSREPQKLFSWYEVDRWNPLNVATGD